VTRPAIASFFETPHDNKPDLMLNITTYIDESQHVGPGHAVVAGFWGTEDQWNGFVSAWEAGLGNRKALHMNGLRWNARGAKKLVRDLLARLGPIPAEHGLCPVYGAVKVGDYLDLVAGESDFNKRLCGYVMDLLRIFVTLNSQVPAHGKIKIVCEQQNTYEPLARGLFEVFAKMAARDPYCPWFNSIEFVPKDATSLTQPSDFLAFAMGKYLDECGGKKDLWCRPIFGHMKPNKIPGCVYTRDRARFLVSAIIKNSKDGRLVGAVEFGKFLRSKGLL